MVRSTTSSPLASLLQVLPAEVAHLVASGIKTRAASRMACSRLKAMVDEGTTSLTWRPENGSLVGSLFSAAFLSRFSNLRRIKVSGIYQAIAPLRDLTPLAACTQLRALDCSYSKVNDLTPLLACTGLQELNLCYCRDLSDLAPLAACTMLVTLNCSHSMVNNLTPLAACTGLEELNLYCCLDLSDLAPLAACNSLQNLNLSNCSNVSNLAPLAACTMLVTLIVVFATIRWIFVLWQGALCSKSSPVPPPTLVFWQLSIGSKPSNVTTPPTSLISVPWQRALSSKW